MVEQPLHPVWGVLTGVLGKLPADLLNRAQEPSGLQP
jgi:hypothetical protein